MTENINIRLRQKNINLRAKMIFGVTIIKTTMEIERSDNFRFKRLLRKGKS